MTCKQCGAQLEDGVLFCSECGASQAAAPEETVAIPVEEPVVIPEEDPIVEETVEEPAAEEAAEESVVEEAAEEPVAEDAAEEPAAEEAVEEPAAEETVEEPVVEEPVAPICPNCGNVLVEGSVFCGECGAKCEIPVPVVIAVEPVEIPAPSPAFCPSCGNALRPGAPFCGRCGSPVNKQPVAEPVKVEQPQAVPAPQETGKKTKQKKEKTKRTRKDRFNPPLGVRILLRFFSLLLCLVLLVSVLATALVLDLRQLTRKESMGKLMTSMLSGDVETTDSPLVGAVMDKTSIPSDAPLNALVEWVYEYLEENFDEEVDISLEQMQDFVARSNGKDLLVGKAAAYVEDFINGTDHTDITVDEVIQLLEDNEELIEDVFCEDGAKLDMDTIKKNVTEFMAENDMNDTIRQEVFVKLEQTPIAGDDYTVKDLLEQFRAVTSDSMLVILIAINVLILVLLFFTNWMRLYATLKWAGTTVIIIGSLLAVPTLLLQVMPNLIGDLFSASMGTAQADMISSFVGLVVGLLAPVHYTIFLIGLAMLIIGTVIKIVRKISAK